MKSALHKILGAAAVASLALSPNLAFADSQTPLGGNAGTKKPCSCRYQGQDVLLGESICMKTASGYRRARCGRYLNNTSWEISDESCMTISRALSPKLGNES